VALSFRTVVAGVVAVGLAPGAGFAWAVATLDCFLAALLSKESVVGWPIALTLVLRSRAGLNGQCDLRNNSIYPAERKLKADACTDLARPSP